MAIEAAKKPADTNDVRPPKATHSQPKRSIRKRTLNIKALVITLLILGIVIPAAWFTHRFQASRIATVFLTRASQLEEKQQWEKAAARISNYLRLHPNDNAQRIRLAETYAKSVEKKPANTTRAAALLYRAVGVAEGDTLVRLRRTLGDLLLNLGRFQSAQDLMVQQPRSSQRDLQNRSPLASHEDQRILATALYGRFLDGSIPGKVELKYGDDTAETYALSELLELAFKNNPTNDALALTIAELYRHHSGALTEGFQAQSEKQRVAEADRFMDKLVDNTKGQANGLLARYWYKSIYDPENAEKDLIEAIRIAPDDPEVLLAAAERARAQGEALYYGTEEARIRSEADEAVVQVGALSAQVVADFQEAVAGPALEQSREQAQTHYQTAEKHYKSLLEQNPEHEGAMLGLGYVALRQDDPDSAIATWKDAAKKYPQSASVQLALADGYLNKEDFGNTVKHLDAAQAILMESGMRAFTPAERSLHLRRIQLLRGRILVEQRRFGEALPQLRSAATVDTNAEQRVDNLAFQAHSLLATCYGSLAQWELAAREFEELSKKRQAQSMEVLYRIAAASSWLLANSGENASRNLEDLVGRYDSAEIWFRIAHARFVREMQQAERDRDWTRVDEALARCRAASAQRQLTDSWRLVLVEAEIASAKASTLTADARTVALQSIADQLRDAESRYNNEKALLSKVIPLYERLGFAQDADRAMLNYEQSGDSPAQIAIVKAELLSLRSAPEQAREVLFAVLDSADEFEKQRIHLALTQLVVASDDDGIEPSKNLYSQSDTSTLVKIRLATQLSDAALLQKRWQDAQKWEQELERLEGADGVYWRAQKARRLLATTDEKDESAIREIERLQSFVVERRPNWSVAHTIKAAIELRLGRTDECINSLLRAVDLGERRVEFLQELSLLLYQQNRLSEADRILSMIDEAAPRKDYLAEVEFEVARRTGERNRALELAQKQVHENPNDIESLLRLGQAQLLLEDAEGAETTLKNAVALDAKNAKAWLSLFHFYIRAGKQEKARETLDSLLAKAEFKPATGPSKGRNPRDPASLKAFAAAQCYELLGDLDRAAASYEQAASGKNEDVQSLLELALFKRRQRDWSGAIDALVKALRINPSNASIKRTLAAAYVARGSDGDLDSALQLVDDGSGAASGDLQLRAAILSRHTGKDYAANLQQAERLLKDLINVPATATPGNRALLARVLVNQSVITSDASAADQKSEEAQSVYASLIAEENPTPSHVLDYIKFLLMRNDRPEARRLLPRLEGALLSTGGSEINSSPVFIAHLRELGFRDEAVEALTRYANLLNSQKTSDPNVLNAFIAVALEVAPNDGVDVWLSKLEEVAPTEFLTLELRARWLNKLGRASEIPAKADEFEERFLERPENARRQDDLFLSVGNLYIALEMFSEAKESYERVTQKTPQATIGLMRVAAGEGEWPKAIEHCITSTQHFKSPLPTTLLVNLFVKSSPSSLDVTELEQLVNDTLRQHGSDPEVLISVANLRIAQQRAQDAVGLLQNALDNRSRNPVALNNLAAVLAEMPGRQQDALDAVHQAIQLDGPSASMLDTKGVALLYSRQTAKAIKCFQAAANLDDKSPIYDFHLAVASDRSGASEEARSYLEAALKRQIESVILTPADQRILNELRQRYLSDLPEQTQWMPARWEVVAASGS